MKRNKNAINTDILTAVEVYKLRLTGKIKKFPQYFWSEIDGLENAKDILRYLIEKVLKWTEDDIRQKYKAEVLHENRLSGMLSICFGGSPYKALDNAYPGKFLPWELINTPTSYWNDDNCRKAIRWLLEERLKWEGTEPIRKITVDDFKENWLLGMLGNRFGNNPYKAINHLYPGRFMEWEATKVSCWSPQLALKAVKWLFEEKLKWSEEDIINNITTYTFLDNDLGGMFKSAFNQSPYKVVETLYPGKYKERDLPYLPSGFWTRETAVEAIRDLFDNKLKWSREDIAKKLDSKTFVKNRLSGPIQAIFNNKAKDAVNAAYPGEFKEWEFKNFKYIDWTEEKLVEAVRWLIEDKLKWSEEDVKKKITQRTFLQNDLNRVIELFDYSPIKAVMTAYPGKYMVWEFCKKPSGFWNKETAVQAVKWLVEEKLHLCGKEALEKVKRVDFERHSLSGMLQICFHSSASRAIRTAYPLEGNKGPIKPYKKIDTTALSAVEVYKLVLSESLSTFPAKFWSGDELLVRAKDILRYLIEEILKWSEEDIKNKYATKVLVDNKLDGLIRAFGASGLFKALDNAYPGRFLPWELPVAPRHYWDDDENCKKALRWLLEEKLKWTDEYPLKKITVEDFRKNSLGGMLAERFGFSPSKAIDF